MPLAATALRLLLESRSNKNANARRVHRLLLNHLVRHAPGPVYVSKAAHVEARERGIEDLRSLAWREQRTVLKDPKRTMFAWDHFHTVKELRDAIERLQEPTEAEVRNILQRSCVVWILRAEDRELTRLGFRQRRPDPHAAYDKAGISFHGRSPPR